MVDTQKFTYKELMDRIYDTVSEVQSNEMSEEETNRYLSDMYDRPTVIDKFTAMVVSSLFHALAIGALDLNNKGQVSDFIDFMSVKITEKMGGEIRQVPVAPAASDQNPEDDWSRINAPSSNSFN